ncbi:MAG: hypothetical protein M0Z65_10790 [Firmicutes bacterium]|uniref:Uncharacterized protein n=1 Tax=Kroppenstedtia guangzhouensis TaxID=1274356 RepID=A0ABQ1GMY3_9BACL|nr:hypothetical protein [Kroppenstedtia guangzhouensis]EGK10214.1 hypothetical protein HMPREF9374_2564 [Desmospora sp. 8437]MDA8353644.1 hypothetical protein [Bacillota bacterium]GGA46999.1 hypothetical protein GCM10007416_20230 [Kroppenstedtia guangzhouensis]
MHYKVIKKTGECLGFIDYLYAVVEVDDDGGETVFADFVTMEQAEALAEKLNREG